MNVDNDEMVGSVVHVDSDVDSEAEAGDDGDHESVGTVVTSLVTTV